MRSSLIQRIYLQGGLGVRIDRLPAADPQAAWQTIFTITGLVQITGLIGVRTVIQAGGASNMQFRHSVGPTVGCLAAAITGDTVNTIYTITGNPNDALIIGLGGTPIQGGGMGSQAVASVQMFGSLAFTGNIQVTMTAAAGTGSTRYVLTYIPLDDAALVVAA
jgi:hypothetical protein